LRRGSTVPWKSIQRWRRRRYGGTLLVDSAGVLSETAVGTNLTVTPL
jgi:hypothetical protein